jgi:hypothetical protein
MDMGNVGLTDAPNEGIKLLQRLFDVVLGVGVGQADVAFTELAKGGAG